MFTSSCECTCDLWVPFNGFATRSYALAKMDMIRFSKFRLSSSITETPLFSKYAATSLLYSIAPCPIPHQTRIKTEAQGQHI